MPLSGHWYATVVARPVPELPDSVTVALVFGNGTLQHLEYDDELSRLQGIISADHRAVMAVALRDAASIVHRMPSLADLRDSLGVQFAVGEPTKLYQAYSRRSIAALRNAYLKALPSPRERMDGLRREALRALDREVMPILPAGLEYPRKRIRLTDLYPGVAEHHATAQIPPVDRVVRSTRRDLILSSVIVRMEERAHLDALVQRTVRQFYFLKRLRSEVERRSKKELLMVGIIQPLEASATSETRMLRSLYEEQWTQYADHVHVLHSAQDASVLAHDLDWAAAGL
jgi:hypothetical protein